MSYTTVVRVVDSSDTGFTACEETVWYYANGGTWSDTDGVMTLSMGGSGTSGGLRFKGKSGEEFIVMLGVHNYKRWCDIVVDLAAGDTNLKIQPTYYQEGEGSRSDMLWKQLAELTKKTAKGTEIHVKYVSEKENHFEVRIFIS